uniref:Ig-like domain-containing protein n=1 Tax=Felis catus TaxID=9685 RepID=A0ABI7ZPC6_FELCA
MVFCRHMTTRERSSTMSGAQASLSPAAMANTQGRDIFPPSCSIIFLLLKLLSYSLSAKGKADFSVSGPGQPVLAMVGESVKLQCHLSLNISAEDMEVRWYRKEPSPAVHLRKKGRDMPEEQMWQYKGRTTFWTAGLAQDQAVLTIRNVTVFDNGTFHCKFKESTGSAEATLWLRVAGLGSEPRIQVRAGQDEGIRAECTSEGWYPEPQVEWRDFRGQTLPSTTNLTVSPTTGLFAVVSNVIVWDRDVGNLSCSISNPLLQKRMETKSHLPGECSAPFDLKISEHPQTVSS